MLNLDPGIFFLQWAINSQCRDSAGEECRKKYIEYSTPNTASISTPPTKALGVSQESGQEPGKGGVPLLFWTQQDYFTLALRITTCRRSSQTKLCHSWDRWSPALPLTETLLAVGSCWWRENHCFWRIWSLIGTPCFSGWPATIYS